LLPYLVEKGGISFWNENYFQNCLLFQKNLCSKKKELFQMAFELALQKFGAGKYFQLVFKLAS
jgi:hypothetical protein